jgi:acetylornithine deacetylase/succinyl-diaminopimelate desuccinylase-like protein
MKPYELYQSLLRPLIEIKSISTDKAFKSKMLDTAEYLQSIFDSRGFDVEIIEDYGNPIVVASFEQDPELETCLIYGHYDVQPADEKDGWDSEPFEVRDDGERLYARGIVDNKGQVLIHIASIFQLIEEDKLGYNIKFMIEGDEETGSPKIESFMKDHNDKLRCDFFLISDGEIIGENPVLDAGFRGGANTTLTIRTAKTDVHSGIFGGAIPSAAHEASTFVASLFNEFNQVTIPGFYDNVDEISDEIRKNNQSMPFSLKELEESVGVKSLKKEMDIDFYSQIGLRPTIQVTGLESGYNKDGYRNGIPCEARVKINFRLVQSQGTEKVLELYREYISNNLPDYCDWDLQEHDIHSAAKIDLDNKYIQKAKEELNKAFGKEPFFAFSGGGLPIVTLYQEYLEAPGVLAGLGNQDCNMHGINENFKIGILKKGLIFSTNFFSD